MKARRFQARRHSGQDVTRGVEELIHAGGAARIQEAPEVFPGRKARDVGDASGQRYQASRF